MGEQLPGSGFLGWLGRQIGHVKTAVKHDPVAAPKKEVQEAKPQAAVVYRTDQVEEHPHPSDPNLKLRRTVIDEVIVDKKKES